MEILLPRMKYTHEIVGTHGGALLLERAPGASSGSKTPRVYRPLWKPEKSAPFSHEKPDIFRICLRYKVNQLS